MITSILEAAVGAPASTRPVVIDFLYLDLDSCDRCIGTDAGLEAAVADVARLLEVAAVQISVRKTLVASEVQARELGFVTSPTIRVNGRDIALELREIRCEAEACACGGGIDCRVWVWQGREYTEAPAAMIVDAILREIYSSADDPMPGAIPAGDVPENLKRFFAGNTPRQSTKDTGCCAPIEQASCCEPAAKVSCRAEAPLGSCGCK